MIEIQPVYSSVEVLNFTGEITKRIIDAKIQGALVECGVAAGSQIAMMQRTLIDNNDQRLIWGFDSFEGIPYATDKDETQPAIGEIDTNKLGLLESTGVSSHSLESVLENFKRYELPIDNLNLVKGWFEETIEPHADQVGDIALLRLDGDLYRSTKVCMKYLYPKLVKGGYLIIDDYQLEGARKAIHEFINPKKIKEIHGIAYYQK
jgi:hypothetical protein